MSYDSGPSMGEQVKMHSGWRWPVLIALGVAFFMVIILFYYVGPTFGDLAGTNPKPTEEATPVSLTIVGAKFTIPGNYIPLPRIREGGEMQEAELEALLPDLSPFAASKAQAFEDVSANSRVVNILLHPNKTSLTEDQMLETTYLNKVKSKDGLTADHGLRVFEFQEETGYETTQLFVGEDTRGAPAVLLCDKENPNVPAPACWRDVRFTAGLSINYKFKRVYLPQWQDIDRRVVDLVASFRAQ